uniref:Methyltransferase type 12 domain-containing protein n=1 Tax=Hanusia phi TaxID=3032 RepID=A0A7S0E2I9_9CRYP
MSFASSSLFASTRPPLPSLLSFSSNPPPFKAPSRLRSGLALAAESSSSSGLRGSVERAIEECKRAVERDPGNEEALFYLGLLLQKSGNSVEAKEAYRKCLALNPGREDAWIQQASVFLSLGDIPAALRSYLSVLERNASSSLAHAGIGRILEQGGKTEAAIVSYQKALRAGGGDKSVFTLLYNLYFRSRRFEAARDVAQKFQETCADDEDASTKLGYALLELGRTAEAEGSFLRAVSLNEDFGPAYNGLGMVYKSQGKIAQAISAYESAIEKMPRGSEASYNLAILLRDQGKVTKACEMLKRALAVDPADTQSQLLLAVLEGSWGQDSLPRDYIENFFDSIAERYDAEILPGLSYSGPAAMVQLLSQSMGGVELAQQDEPLSVFPDESTGGGRRGWTGEKGFPALGWRAADIGCGTGLCGAAFRPACREMIGCDVSEKMCKVAEEKEIYDRVEREEAVRFLAKLPPDSFDLLLAGDVFPYIADLRPVLLLAHKCLRHGGRFLFTVEQPLVSDVQVSGRMERARLNKNARFSHAEEEVKDLCRLSRLKVLASSGCVSCDLRGSRSSRSEAALLASRLCSRSLSELLTCRLRAGDSSEDKCSSSPRTAMPVSEVPRKSASKATAASSSHSRHSLSPSALASLVSLAWLRALVSSVAVIRWLVVSSDGSDLAGNTAGASSTSHVRVLTAGLETCRDVLFVFFKGGARVSPPWRSVRSDWFDISLDIACFS